MVTSATSAFAGSRIRALPGLVAVFAAVVLASGAVAGRPAVETATRSSPRQGSVQGRVTFGGTQPEVAPTALLAADPFCATQHDEPMILRPVGVGSSGGLRNVVVYLRDAPVSRSSDSEVLLDQRACVYTPHVISASVGQTVVFRNSDMTLHNMHAEPEANPAFNVGQPFQGFETRRAFANPELGIPIRCDIHPWMSAFLSVFGHPFHAVTDANGNFEIGEVPDGSYVIEARHEVLGTLSQQITIAGGDTTVAFRFDQ